MSDDNQLFSFCVCNFVAFSFRTSLIVFSRVDSFKNLSFVYIFE